MTIATHSFGKLISCNEFCSSEFRNVNEGKHPLTSAISIVGFSVVFQAQVSENAGVFLKAVQDQ